MGEPDVVVTVRFSVRVAPDRFVVEPDAGEVAAAVADLYGRVVVDLVDASGPPSEVFLEDDLTALVANVCFQAPAQLSAGVPFAAYVTRYPGDIAMERDGARVRLSGNAVFTADGQPDAALDLPADALLTELHACGDRVLALLHRLLGDDPAQADVLTGLDGLRAESAAALGH